MKIFTAGEGRIIKIKALVKACSAENLSPVPTDIGVGDAVNGDNFKAAAYLGGIFKAGVYSGYRGLSTPMRSTIYRSIRGSGAAASEAAEAFATEAIVAASAGHAIWKSGSAALNGTCH
jgi:hypothetical protein